MNMNSDYRSVVSSRHAGSSGVVNHTIDAARQMVRCALHGFCKNLLPRRSSSVLNEWLDVLHGFEWTLRIWFL